MTDARLFQRVQAVLWVAQGDPSSEVAELTGVSGQTIYNWLQHFDPTSLAAELRGAGLEVASVLGDVAGAPYDPDRPEFAVVARRAADS